MKLIVIPPGTFQIGSDSGDKIEKPIHNVTIGQSFQLGATEVSQSQFQAVMGTTPWKSQSEVKEGPDFAVSYVSWDDAVEFCRRLSAMENRTYRLPTEAEWEYACRAGTSTEYCYGGSIDQLSDYAWWGGNSDKVGEKYAHRVGVKKPNAWGLSDMHGNVWEWCSDWFGAYPSGNVNDPEGPIGGNYRICRGGNWAVWDAGFCRSAYRGMRPPDNRTNHVGFRVVSDLHVAETVDHGNLPTDGWTDLFNGRDLTAWEVLEPFPDPQQPNLFTTHRPSSGGWDVRGGVLLCKTDKPGLLRTKKEYGDFQLQLDFKMPASGNSGVYIRTPASGHSSQVGMEVQLVDEDHPDQKQANRPGNGTIQYGPPATRKAARTVGNWNSLDVECAGDVITIKINDVVVNRADMGSDPDLKDRPRRGYIGLANWKGLANGCEFRNIRIRE